MNDAIREYNRILKKLYKQTPLNMDAIRHYEYLKKVEKMKEKQIRDKERAERKKILKKQHKDQKAEWKKLVRNADTVFSQYIRLRDTKWWRVRCVTCDSIVTYKTAHCCHRLSRAFYSHRRDENNAKAGCCHCNTFDKENHHNAFTLYQVKKFWLERVEEQMRIKNNKKPTNDELQEIIKNYKIKIKHLENIYHFKVNWQQWTN